MQTSRKDVKVDANCSMITWAPSMVVLFSNRCCRRICCSEPLLSKLLLLMLVLLWQRSWLRIPLGSSSNVDATNVVVRAGSSIVHDVGDQDVVSILVVVSITDVLDDVVVVLVPVVFDAADRFHVVDVVDFAST